MVLLSNLPQAGCYQPENWKFTFSIIFLVQPMYFSHGIFWKMMVKLETVQ